MMAALRALLARFLTTVRGRIDDRTADLREEMEAHLAMQIDDYVRRGLPPHEARRRALLESGGITTAAEAVRDQRGLAWLDRLVSDFVAAARALRRNLGFASIVILTLALGIGANTAIFSVVRGVLLKPLPHREGERLIYVRHAMDGPGGDNLAFSVPEVADLRAGVPAFGAMAEFSDWTLRIQREEGTVRIPVGLVTGNYFEVMGLAPVLGRVTLQSDDGPAASAVAVLTHDYWVREFGADSGVVGRQVRMDGQPVTVVGVVEPAPFFPRVDALLNMVVSEHHQSATMVQGRTHRMTQVVARLAPSATLEQARAQVAAVYARMQQAHPDAYHADARFRVALLPLRDALGERARMPLLLLMVVALFVMVTAAANVTNLTLMRGVRRGHELVIRAALGAGVSRLRRLLLAEHLLLALVGAAAGIAVAWSGLRLLIALAARYSPRASEVRLDATVLAFTLGVAAAVALLLSYLAALPGERTLGARILAGSQRVAGGVTRQRMQRGLVVLQVAVSVVLLAGAGLLTRTMLRLGEVSTGLRTEEVLTLSVALLTPAQLLSDPQADGRAKEQYDRMRREVGALPGVVAVGLGSPAPLRSSDVRFDVAVEGRPVDAATPLPRAEFRTADPTFFDAAGIPVLEGRPFATTDVRGAARVVILNKTLADRLFPGESPIGHRVAWTGDILRFTPFSREWRTVVGVVATTKDGGLDAPPQPAMYMPFAQEVAIGGGLVLRADSNVAQLSATATRIVRQLAPTSPVERVMTVAQIRDESVAPRRLNAALVSSFGLLAVVIAAVGIAGVLAFSVSARTAEIGIRMSLGADRARVLRMILREGGTLVALGLALGAVAAFLGARVIQGLLFGVAPHDALTFVTVCTVMLFIGLVACWIPARRASHIDPARTLRS
jgi:predicted permease